jgi:hypothetical protein
MKPVQDECEGTRDLRTQVNNGALCRVLNHDLAGVVSETKQPVEVSLRLRPDAPSRGEEGCSHKVS